MNKHLLRKFFVFLFIASLASCGGGGDEDVGGEPTPVEPPAGFFSAVSAGGDHTCAIRRDTGLVACWGLDDQGQATPPLGFFSTVSAGGDHTCAIRRDTGLVACWGLDDQGQATPPLGFFSTVSAGGDHTCAIRRDTGLVACWGLDDEGQSTPPLGIFTALSAGGDHTCALRDTGVVACWGLDDEGQSTPPLGIFTALSAGGDHTCALRDTGVVACWGLDDEGQSTPPLGIFTALSAGGDHTCALRDTGVVACWGLDDEGQSTPPLGIFTALSAGGDHTCGILDSGAVACWGLDDQGQSAPPDPAAKTDLMVHSPRVSDNNPHAGASFTLAVTLRNNGIEASAPTTLRYYRSTDATITSSNTLVGTDAVGTLAAAGTSVKSVNLTAPSSAGTYYYGACVEAVADESDTTNNCSISVQVTVPELGPDLVVQSPSVSDSSLETGGTFTLSVTVSNRGDGEAPATTLRYYRSTDATITSSDTLVVTAAVTGLASSASSSKSVQVNAPSTAGRYYYGACVDAVTDEPNTTNNCSASVQVDVEAPTYPELSVGPAVVSNNAPVIGESFGLSTTVTNLGDGESVATTLRYYLSTDATIDASDTEVGNG